MYSELLCREPPPCDGARLACRRCLVHAEQFGPRARRTAALRSTPATLGDGLELVARAGGYTSSTGDAFEPTADAVEKFPDSSQVPFHTRESRAAGLTCRGTPERDPGASSRRVTECTGAEGAHDQLRRRSLRGLVLAVRGSGSPRPPRSELDEPRLAQISSIARWASRYEAAAHRRCRLRAQPRDRARPCPG